MEISINAGTRGPLNQSAYSKIWNDAKRMILNVDQALLDQERAEEKMETRKNKEIRSSLS